jgi:hypothetical protein
LDISAHRGVRKYPPSALRRHRRGRPYGDRAWRFGRGGLGLFLGRECLATLDSMEVDAELLAAARAAQARVVEAERAVDLARAEFRYSVRELHFAGASLRERGTP